MSKLDWLSNENAIKWYKTLKFPQDCDEEFYALVKEFDCSCIDQENPVKYLVQEKNKGLNLLYCLAKCEHMQEAAEYFEKLIEHRAVAYQDNYTYILIKKQ